MKLPKFMNTIPAFAKHTWVLYLVTALSFLNILGFIQRGYLEHVLIYILLAALVFQYTKNMVFVLGIPLISVHLYLYVYNTLEGIRNKRVLKNRKSESESNASSFLPIAVLNK